MKGVDLIRGQGLRHRMEVPALFRKRMNQLCIQMTHTPKKTEGQKHREKMLRKMDKLIGTVAKHARCYRKILDEQWQQTEWTRPQAEQVPRRLDSVLDQLTAAREQAWQRIIDEEPVANQNKILSLYESAIRVVVRHKAGAEVEFGNTLLLGESRQGLIMHWELIEQSAPADARLVKGSVESIEKNLQIEIKELGANRGFDSADIQKWLAGEKTYNGICPRDPHRLKERMGSWKFVKLQRRRSQTEGRISIIIHNFLGCPIRSKGFAHRQLAVGWGVLTRNLWVLARLPIRQAKKKAAPLLNAAWSPIEKVERQVGKCAVLNLEVEGFHTYFVGAGGLCVHNPSPYGSRGNPVHQKGVAALQKSMAQSHPNCDITGNRRILPDTGLDRRPDSIARDKVTGKLVAVGEVAPTLADGVTLKPRERAKQKQYKRLRLPCQIMRIK